MANKMTLHQAGVALVEDMSLAVNRLRAGNTVSIDHVRQVRLLATRLEREMKELEMVAMLGTLNEVGNEAKVYFTGKTLGTTTLEGK